MITGNSAWTTAINSNYKRPLYVFSIPGKSVDLCSFLPLTLITGGDSLLPILQIPKGAAQTIDELTGHSSISTLEITAVDPTGVLKSLASDITATGQKCQLKLGFPGLDLSEFVVIHTGRIQSIGRSTQGIIKIAVHDFLSSLVTEIFNNGGPNPWFPGQVKNPAPAFSPSILDNGIPIGDNNPRYLSGNPMDILLAVMQNELGIGQSSPPIRVVNTGGGSGSGVMGYGVNPGWLFYNIVDPATLIYPNPYIDALEITRLRDNELSGLRMEWMITGPENGKTWIEDEIMRVCGLYWVTKANGQLMPKSMKHPGSVSPITITDHEIIGIPETTRWPVLNVVTATIPVDADASDTTDIPFASQASIDLYQSLNYHTVSANGLRFGYGALGQLFLLCNRIFNRHSFSTPEYTIVAYFKHIVAELGDFLLLSHAQVLDLVSGTISVTDVLCEIVDRQPDYANGTITFRAIDCRFVKTAGGQWQIAPVGIGFSNWTSASTPQKNQFIFVSDNSGLMSDTTPGHPAS